MKIPIVLRVLFLGTFSQAGRTRSDPPYWPTSAGSCDPLADLLSKKHIENEGEFRKKNRHNEFISIFEKLDF